MLVEEELTGQIIGAAIEVHRMVGPGLLESAYQTCFARELTLRGLDFKRELILPVHYKGVSASSGYRLDFLVKGRVIVELKAVTAIEDIHRAQVLTYLRLSNHPVALLFNFHSPKLMTKQGYCRFVQ